MGGLWRRLVREQGHVGREHGVAGRLDVGRAQLGVGAGDDDDGVVAVGGDRDLRHAGAVLRRRLHEARVDVVLAQVGHVVGAEPVIADLEQRSAE